jgi:hypothetical protein
VGGGLLAGININNSNAWASLGTGAGGLWPEVPRGRWPAGSKFWLMEANTEGRGRAFRAYCRALRSHLVQFHHFININAPCGLVAVYCLGIVRA